MADVKEFRIGNWVFEPECEPYYFQIEEIRRGEAFDGHFVVYRNGSIKSSDPNPVPLTEEKLLEFGFKKEKVGFSGADMWQGMDAWLFDGEWLFRGSPQNGLRLVGYFNSSIQYVHQLQNICFDLKGQELKKSYDKD